LAAAGLEVRALELARQALTRAPDDSETSTLARELLSKSVPRWHFAIVRDSLRNQAYDAALRRAVFPGCTVLEIGTGSGLLAMMAARAGAGRVITCEADPAIARAARDVIAANGFADRVHVIDKHSTMLDPLADMGGLADVLVSEIVSNDLISQGALTAHEHAVAALLKRGAQVIPARGRVRIALAEDCHWNARHMGMIDGFDPSCFNRLAKPYSEIAIDQARLTLRSGHHDMFGFDFASGGPWADRRGEAVLESRGGLVNGLAQWILLEMDDEDRYENRPVTGMKSCWVSIFWPFAHPLETRAGDSIRICARHEKDRIRFWRSSMAPP